MANDSTIESFAIRVSVLLVRRAEGEPDTPVDTVRGEDSVAVGFRVRG
jgi:hypothetical protein